MSKDQRSFLNIELDQRTTCLVRSFTFKSVTKRPLICRHSLISFWKIKPSTTKKKKKKCDQTAKWSIAQQLQLPFVRLNWQFWLMWRAAFSLPPRLGPATLSGPLQLHYKSAFQQCHRCEWCFFALITVIAGQSLFLLLLCYGGHEMGVFLGSFYPK